MLLESTRACFYNLCYPIRVQVSQESDSKVILHNTIENKKLKRAMLEAGHPKTHHRPSPMNKNDKNKNNKNNNSSSSNNNDNHTTTTNNNNKNNTKQQQQKAIYHA
ncbi:unnamed protein product [Polarella glacialis]|uniref:Uncharacterized protein n=1 Tax=Polarella glacialis TaxID=89957 RepID=A0A813K624_POLGL|nr:unnamed protein product [Polarella glacialis]